MWTDCSLAGGRRREAEGEVKEIQRERTQCTEAALEMKKETWWGIQVAKELRESTWKQPESKQGSLHGTEFYQPPKRNATLLPPWFHSCKTSYDRAPSCVVLYLDLWPTEVWDNTWILFETTKFLIICYSSNNQYHRVQGFSGCVLSFLKQW